MTRLVMFLFSMISTTLMGVGVIVTLVTGYGPLYPILVGVAVGFVLSVPQSWIFAKQIAG